jgi:hypothetical protein
MLLIIRKQQQIKENEKAKIIKRNYMLKKGSGSGDDDDHDKDR